MPRTTGSIPIPGTKLPTCMRIDSTIAPVSKPNSSTLSEARMEVVHISTLLRGLTPRAFLTIKKLAGS